MCRYRAQRCVACAVRTYTTMQHNCATEACIATPYSDGHLYATQEYNTRATEACTKCGAFGRRRVCGATNPSVAAQRAHLLAMKTCKTTSIVYVLERQNDGQESAIKIEKIANELKDRMMGACMAAGTLHC